MRKQSPYTSSYTLYKPKNNLSNILEQTSTTFRKPLTKDILLPKAQNIRKRPVKTKPLNGPSLAQTVSASSWILYDYQRDSTYGNRISAEKEIASLTKIMTCIIVLELKQKYKLDKNVKVKVDKASTKLGGTSANLIDDSWINLNDLVYGLMLPSGNDAAWLLAEVFGLLMYHQKYKSKETLYQDIESIDVSIYQVTDHFVSYFLKNMNKKAKLLGMTNTNFANPHGLNNPLNYSSAKDLLALSRYCLKNQQFVEVVNTQSFVSNVQIDEEKIQLQWKNTNKLLEYGWMGIKTGQTTSAGACLASYKKQILIIVLNSNGLEKRFDDTLCIYDGYQKWKINQLEELIENNQYL